MKSKEILPENERINFRVWEDKEREEFGTLGEQIQYNTNSQSKLLHQYHLALETAEQEIQDCCDLYNELSDHLDDIHNEYLNESPQKNYEKSLRTMLPNNESTTILELEESVKLIYGYGEETINALKIASGLID